MVPGTLEPLYKTSVSYSAELCGAFYYTKVKTAQLFSGKGTVNA